MCALAQTPTSRKLNAESREVYKRNISFIMHNNKKNEELQSRREFFKRAAKGALPILGAMLLANIPNVMEAESPKMGCGSSCRGSCLGACYGGCNISCQGGCKNGCGGTCHNGCLGGCKGNCVGGCKNACTSSSKW